MKASISVHPDVPIDGIVELAVRAESHGFGRCWVGDGGRATRDVFVVMHAIAVATREMEVGPGPADIDARTASQIAVGVASVGESLQGRVAVAVGGDDPEQVQAAVAGLRSGLEGNSRLDFAPDDVEIWLMTRSTDMFALGGEIADGVMLDLVPFSQLEDSIAAVRSGGDARIGWRTSVLTSHDDPDTLRPHLAPVLGTDLDLADLAITGSILECAGRLHGAALELGVDEFVLPLFRMPAPHRYLDRCAQVLAAARR